MFERFTDRARHVVVLAQEESRALKHKHIGTEHLLLGLIREDEGVAGRALTTLGVELNAARDQVLAFMEKGVSESPSHIPFTTRHKRVLELALLEALRRDHTYIGTEHLLLGLIREGEGVGAQVLTKLGIDLGTLQRQVVYQLDNGGNVRTASALPLLEVIIQETLREHATSLSLVERAKLRDELVRVLRPQMRL